MRLLLLTLAISAAYPLFAGLAAAFYGPAAWASGLLAAGLCWLGATMALVAIAWLRGPEQALYAMLTGMFLRMGLPLVASVALALRFPALNETGFIPLILGFYLVTLAAETLLVLPLVHGSGSRAKVL